MKEEFYTSHEIANKLKVAYMTVYRWIRAGKLKAYQIEKQYRVKRDDFDKFIESYKK